jgi:outer membrane protein assembly factor BamB
MATTQSQFTSATGLLRTFATATWITAMFCALVSIAMLYQHSVASERDPWKSPQLLALKEQLRAAPTDESLRNEIRRLDLEFRERYSRRLTLDRTGGWLLVGGMAVMLLAGRQTAKLRTRQWLPKLKTDAASETRRLTTQARWAVAGVGAVIVVGLAALAFTASSALPDSTAELNKLLGRTPDGAPVEDLASIDEFRVNWPRFRGMDGGGAVTLTNSTQVWNAKTGTNVIWQTPTPAPGLSSPVVWGNRIFISGGDATNREVFCFDAKGGKLLWRRAIENVPGSPAKFEIYDPPGFAAPTMVCDGRRVMVLFANGDLAALTLDGAPAWSKNIGIPKNMYGHASSLAIWPGKLVVQLDQDEGTPGGSKLLAFDCATGRLLWESPRKSPATWASPIIVEAAGKTQIITFGSPHVTGYSLTDGSELWRAELLEGEIAPSPLFAAGLVIAISPSGSLIAIRPDGAGDVTKTHVAWSVEDLMPDITSPVSNGELVFTVTSSGGLACYDIKNGKKLWEHNLDMEVQSSPGIAGGSLLLLSTKGDVVVAEAGREFNEQGRMKLADEFYACPAFTDGRVYLRGTTNLWCLGTKTDQ